MSYKLVADMQADQLLTRRIIACAALEKIKEPHQWVSSLMWYFAAQPGWAASWASAQESQLDNIGNDEGVITDGMILSAVQFAKPPVV